jgi:glycosyltransferase involved in cell wall biosynthesis
MKILLLSTRIPAPEKKGDQVIAWFRASYLARTHQVEIVCFGDASAKEDLAAKQRLEEQGIIVHLVRRSSFHALWQLLRAVPNQRMPFQSAWFRSSSFQRVAREVQERMEPDALYAIMVRILPNLPVEKQPPLLYIEMVDSMGLNFSRRAEMARGLKRWLINLECRRISRAEREAAALAQCSFVVSHIDQKAIGSRKVEVIPLGIDFQRFKQESSPKSAPVVVFTGTMSYQPNIDAVEWFVHHCWQTVKQAVPSVKLIIAGGNPDAAVKALAQKDPAITVTGRVPSIAAILNEATVAIAPMQSGSGMQFKILEAMACATPVVTTTIGLGDIAAERGKELLTADTPSEFSQAVISLLQESAIATSIGDNGMNYVHHNHNWETLNHRFAELCHFTPAN